MPAAGPSRRFDAVSLWLAVIIVMVFAMVILGGVTRLTEAGLSIVNWDPIIGAVPPLSQEAWERAFDAYKQFPEYQRLNRGMELGAFKAIYLMEYAHRLWGRLIGLAFALPLAWFVIAGRVRGRLAWALGGILLLGAAQGAVGWVMVASGLVDEPRVSPYRLALHLALAVAIYLALLWILLGRVLRPSGARALARPAGAALALGLATILAGAFVAGLDAGLTYNTFPLMDGQLVPPGLWDLTPWWRNLFENVATVQFNHRLAAAATLLATLWLGMTAVKAEPPRRAIAAAHAAMTMALVQVGLGIATLLLVVPVALGALHQAGALILAGLLTWTLFESRAPAP